MDKTYYFIDKNKNVIELYFTKVPRAFLRQKLKSLHWSWQPIKKCWSHVLNDYNLKFAQQLGTEKILNRSKPSTVTATPVINSNNALFDRFKSLTGNQMSEEELIKHLLEATGPTPEKVKMTTELSRVDNGFVTVLFSSSGKIINIGITDDLELQNSSKNIYWIERTISKNIIYGIVNNKPWILFNGEICLIACYSDCQYINNIIAHSTYFSNKSEPAEIWIYNLKLPCSRHPEKVETVTAFIPVNDDTQSKPANIYYCPICNKYYINIEQYNQFAKKYGLPFVKLRTNSPTMIDYTDFKDESILHIMGYNVNCIDALSSSERHNILIHALATNTLTKAQIISFIEFLIYRNKNKLKLENACSKWRDDVNFIRNLNIDKQRKIIGTFKPNK